MEKLVNSLANQKFNVRKIKDINEVYLDPTYLNLIIQNTPSRYIGLAINDRCSLYDMLHTNLLRLPNGEIKNVIINYRNKESKIQKRLMTLQSFFTKVAYKQCPKVKIFNTYFRPQNLRNTLSKIKLESPKSKKECIDTIKEMQNDYKAPYLCHIVEEMRGLSQLTQRLNNLSKADFKDRTLIQKKIKIAKLYRKLVSPNAAEVLKERCLNLDAPEKYCAGYFKKNFWTTEHLRDKKSPIFSSFCDTKNTKQCVIKLNKDQSVCQKQSEDYPALFPRPDCNKTSQTLIASRLFKDYKDCPYKVGNLAVTTFGRLLNHHEDYITNQKFNCHTSLTYPVAKINEELTEFGSWQIRACYDDKIKRKKVCHPVVLGHVKNDDLSITKVMKKIAGRQRGYQGAECELISENEYKPTLLKFKTGCYIITDNKECTATQCKFKVIIDEEDFTSYTFESDLRFNLFSTDFLGENKAMIPVYANKKRKELKIIKNISSFEKTFNDKKNSIFVGVGCAEDLLPSHFKRNHINECRPLPFIVDGYFEDKGIYSLITRTSYDHLHAPRVIAWNYIFSAIKNYQNLHPINAWRFYAIY